MKFTLHYKLKHNIKKPPMVNKVAESSFPSEDCQDFQDPFS